MRTVIFLYTSFLSTIILVAIISVIISHASYEEVIQQNLEESIEYSMKMLQRDRVYARNGVEGEDDNTGFYGNFNKYMTNESLSLSLPSNTLNAEFKKAFIGYLTSNLDTRVTNLVVDFYGAEENEGLLSVEVTAEFNYPMSAVTSDGTLANVPGSVSVFKTIILEKEVKDNLVDEHPVEE